MTRREGATPAGALLGLALVALGATNAWFEGIRADETGTGGDLLRWYIAPLAGVGLVIAVVSVLLAAAWSRGRSAGRPDARPTGPVQHTS